MTAPVFVVDTNVVVAGLLTASRGSPVTAILDAMLSGSLLYQLSPELLAEYRSVLSRPKLARLHGLHEAEIDVLLVDLTANAVWREPGPGTRAPDCGDDHLWALLAAHAGSVLITGDRTLLAHPPSRHAVISPREYIGRLR